MSTLSVLLSGLHKSITRSVVPWFASGINKFQDFSTTFSVLFNAVNPFDVSLMTKFVDWLSLFFETKLNFKLLILQTYYDKN